MEVRIHMSMEELTNDAKYLLTSMYSKYLDERKAGKTKEQAIKFGGAEDIHQKLMPEWSFEDVEFTCFELRQHGYINAAAASNTLFYITLSTSAIASLETTFKDKVDSVLDYAAKIKNAIPFV